MPPLFSCYFDYKFAGRFFLRPEVGITQKGVVFNQYDYERIIYEVKITYLQFPLTLGYQVVSKDHFIVELNAGTAGAFKLNAFKNVGSPSSHDHHIKLKNIRNYDFSLLVGFNVKWKLWEKYFLFDVTSFIGLTNILNPIDTKVHLYSHTQKTKNAGLVLSLGYEITK